MNRTEQNKTFAAWVESHNAILWKVARSFAPEEDQEDLHQDLLVALWQALPAFRQDSKVSTFVYRVAFNRALTWVRKRRQSLKAVQLSAHLAETVAAPPCAARAAQGRLDLLYQEIRRLPESDRTIVLLHLDDLSYRDMAAVLGISENNVGVRLNRAKKRLAEQMLAEQVKEVSDEF